MAFPQANSRDEAHAAIAEAFRLIGQPNEKSEKLIQLDELNAGKQEAKDLFEAPSVEPSSRNSSTSYPSTNSTSASGVTRAIDDCGRFLTSISFSAWLSLN